MSLLQAQLAIIRSTTDKVTYVPKRQPRAVSRHDSDEAPVGLCVRVPKTLHRALKLHCTVREVMIEAFVE